jgi:Ni/Co efflux regulator RcnB
MDLGGLPAADKDIAMKHPGMIITASLLLAGAFSASALAQDARYAYPDPLYANGDADNDGIPNSRDPVDNRYDEAGNPVRFEVGETLPVDSYGSETLVDAKSYGLRAPAVGQAWHHLGNNFYLIDASTGRVSDAVYNKSPR